MKKVLSAALAIIFSLSLAGCVSEVSGQDVYTQEVNWTSCEGRKFECAQIKVPLDWSKPAGELIELSAVRKTVKSAIGSLLLNPGGPGASGYDFLVNNYDDLGTQDLRDSYNLVSFDPRGVSRSSKVTCFDAKGTDHLLYDSNDAPIGSKQEMQLQRGEIKKFAEACLKNTGPLLGHVDTVSAAKDMDVIRAVLGEDKLNYLGYSYGTFLGTTYAALFPDRVGRFVLDGAIDPRVSDEQQSLNQLKGFDLALTNYLRDCLANDPECPFTGTLNDARGQLTEFLRSMESKTLDTEDGRKLTITGLTTGLSMTMYSDTYWTYLTQAINDAKNDDGTMFIRLADFYNDRQDDGTYSGNSLEANISVNCLDSRSSAKPKDMSNQNVKLLKLSPILGRYWQNGAITCEQWPFPVTERPQSYAAVGAPTILVVGTTGDPATPYEQSVALAHEVLAKGFLVTFQGDGHTAYGRSNECVSSAVDDFLIDGVLPKKEPVC